MKLRTYRLSDLKEIMHLFYNTVHVVNARDYSAEQVNAWAPQDPDENQWDNSFREHYTIVAVENHEIVGFGDIDATNFVMEKKAPED